MKQPPKALFPWLLVLAIALLCVSLAVTIWRDLDPAPVDPVVIKCDGTTCQPVE